MQLHSLSTILFLMISASSLATFNNVTVQFESLDDFYEFTTTIEYSDNLRNKLPDKQFTRITISGRVPIIYENSITDLPKLQILQLQRLQIEVIEPGSFKNVPLLEVLRLNSNKLKIIEDGVFNNLNVVYLSLEHNLIENISLGAFDNLPKLKVLSLDGNKLKEFHPQWIENKPTLVTASFTYNEIEELPDGAFENYQNDIYFNNNKIVRVDNAVFGERLGEFGLGDNFVEEWDETLLSGVQIRAFDISNNKLQCINGSLDNFFVAYQTRIYGNPWDCDCLMRIDKWVKEHKRKVNMRTSLKKCI